MKGWSTRCTEGKPVMLSMHEQMSICAPNSTDLVLCRYKEKVSVAWNWVKGA